MPRPKQSGGSSYSSGQASYVLDRLVADRRISPGEITRYVSEMGREISELEARLASLRAAHGGGGGSYSAGGGAAVPAKRGPGRPPGGGAKRGPGRPPASAGGAKRGPGRPPGGGVKRGPGRPSAPPSGAGAGGGAGAAKGGGGRKQRAAITPEQLASRQLQGRYLALVRQFPATKRALYAKTAKEKGREAAIKEMQDSLRK
jgi:hypothetical protein